MQFNQTNQNHGDVNNAISNSGNIVQSKGDNNRIQVDRPKETFLAALWKKLKSLGKWFAGVGGSSQ